MSQVPNVEDPVLAVVLERLENLKSSFEKFEEKVDEKFAKQDAKIEAVKQGQAKVDTVLTKWAGGWMVLVGIGAVAGTILSLWEKLAKMWHG